MTMLQSRSFKLIHDFDVKETGLDPKLPILKGSFGADIYALAKDREIVTDPDETRRRRAIKLVRNHHNSWGFTLQTYGVRNKRSGEIEVMTYVDYVEIKGPAWVAGMQPGDMILSVNGESVESATHREVVAKIRKSGRELRLVVLFENCCTKVDLQERYLKLKKLLKLKLKELHRLEDEERKLKGESSLSRDDSYRQSTTSSMCSDWDAYSEMVYPSKATFDLSTSELSSSTSQLDQSFSEMSTKSGIAPVGSDKARQNSDLQHNLAVSASAYPDANSTTKLADSGKLVLHHRIPTVSDHGQGTVDDAFLSSRQSENVLHIKQTDVEFHNNKFGDKEKSHAPVNFQSNSNISHRQTKEDQSSFTGSHIPNDSTNQYVEKNIDLLPSSCNSKPTSKEVFSSHRQHHQQSCLTLHVSANSGESVTVDDRKLEKGVLVNDVTLFTRL